MILHLSKQIEATRVKRIQRELALAMTLTFLSELVGLKSLSDVLSIVFVLALWSAYYALMFQALKRMLYSFLTMVAIVSIFNATTSIALMVEGNWPKAIIVAINFVATASIVFTINRPIFFPKINWTEYDFRHRKDRRVRITVGEGLFENARLYDMRRGEAALMCFAELALDNEYQLEDGDGESIGRIKIISQRKTLLGRPITHGIRFLERR